MLLGVLPEPLWEWSKSHRWMATGSNLRQAEPGVTELEPEIPRPFSGSAAAGSQRVLSLAAALRCCTFCDFVQRV